MNFAEFKSYRDQRINALSDAYSHLEDQYSNDPQVRKEWLELRCSWSAHANDVLTYAIEEDLSGLMDYWRVIVKEGRYSNEYEGIGLNIGLTTENINEILTTSVDDENMYWITEHLKNHPNYHK